MEGIFRHALVGASALLTVSACLSSPQPSAIDAGATDASADIDGPAHDAASIDAAVPDAGALDDGGAATDAEPSVDAPFMVDAAPAFDANTIDATPAPDAGPPTSVVDVAAGDNHTCAVLDNGAVRCWGAGGFGRLGYGDTDDIGDTETPASKGDVPLGASADAVCAGDDHSCALLRSGKVRCWGRGIAGALGYGGSGSAYNIGDDEPPSDYGDVPLAGTVAQIVCGDGFTCARMDTGDVRCWGWNLYGQLGIGGTANVDDASDAQAVDLGVDRTAIDIASGGQHVCAVLDDGDVRCWGRNSRGQLGLGTTDDLGDDTDETPATVSPVDLGGIDALDVSVGLQHTCVVLTGGGVRCWGEGQLGRLGYADLYGYDPSTTDPVDIGDDESLAELVDVDLGASAARLAIGAYHSCAKTSSSNLRCWGSNQVGALGYGAAYGSVGIVQAPSVAGDVPVGETIAAVAAGASHTCVLLTRGAIRCWGVNDDGRLGYGDTDLRGRSADTEPRDLDDVPVF